MKSIVLKLARDDLKEIRDYLSEFGANLAREFRESFEKFCIQVESMPYMFSQYEHNQKYRRAVIKYDYLVSYQIDETNSRAKVYRVLHGKRGIVNLLDSEEAHV